MNVAKNRSPVLDVDGDEETSLVEAPVPPEALPPPANRTRRLEKIDPMLLARTRDRSMAPVALHGPVAYFPARPPASPLAHRRFAKLGVLPRVRPALPTQVLATPAISSVPPPLSVGGATMPAPPPAMTGAIFVDDSLFADPAEPEDVFAPTGTIDVDESWLEDEDLLDDDVAPESFWLRGKAKTR